MDGGSGGAVGLTGGTDRGGADGVLRLARRAVTVRRSRRGRVEHGRPARVRVEGDAEADLHRAADGDRSGRPR